MIYFWVIFYAATLDIIQGAIMLALTASGFILTALIGWIPFIGQLAAGSVDVGLLILGMIIDVSISATFGTGLIVLMLLSGIMKPRELIGVRRLPLVLAKFIPLIGALPTYTALAISVCAADKKRRATAQLAARERAKAPQNEVE